jgi:hypothetical protein
MMKLESMQNHMLSLSRRQCTMQTGLAMLTLEVRVDPCTLIEMEIHK